MNATTTKEHVNRWRAAHHSALETLANSINPKNKLTGLQLWRKLRRIEAEASKQATAYCNGEINSEQWQTAQSAITDMVADCFGGRIPMGFFVNGDPRGYALKLDNESVTIPDGMHKDFGGYGILAAVIE